MSELKLFDKYSFSEVDVKCISLKPYINVTKQSIIPHTSNTETFSRMGKSKASIVERFVCAFMRHGRNSGKKRLAIRIVEDAFYIINTVTKENPIQVLADAIANAGPREESARVGRGGSMKRMAIDVTPMKRISVGIALLANAIRKAAFKNPKTIGECIADELIAAAKNSPNSSAVKKKDEIERIAKSNR